MPSKSKEASTKLESAVATEKKETPASKASTTKSTAKSSTRKSSAKKSSATKQTTVSKKTQPKTEQPPNEKVAQVTAVQEELIVTDIDNISKGDEPPKMTSKSETASTAAQTEAQTKSTQDNSLASMFTGNGIAKGADFRAADLMNGEIWAPNTAIPQLDEKTYTAQKAQAEAQRRAIEVAKLNLQNINDMHQLEQESLNVAISAKSNKTRGAQLTGADIDYRTQLALNGEKSQTLAQATSRHQAAVRETQYIDQLIDLKDQNFELDIQQAQSVFAEKAARYRAQLTGGE